MKRFKIIEETAGQKFGSFRRFCIETGQDYSNFKRKLLANLVKIDGWIKPLGLEIQIVLKKQKRAGKNKKNTTADL
jgi:hypothetical protein